jgi:C1A family cysteine protease
MKARVPRFSFSMVLGVLALAGLLLLASGPLMGISSSASEGGGFSPINPAYLEFLQLQEQAAQDPVSAQSSQTRGLGYIPSPLDLSDLVISPPGVEESLPPAAAFETTFDLRSQNRVSPVKDQGSYNTCWAFAAMGSSEGGLLRFASSPNPSERDFSEWHLSYLAYKDTASRSFTLGTDDVFMKGGNDWKSIALLARWTGIASEASSPYGGAYPTGSEPQVFHLQDAYFLPIRSGVSFSAENVKTALKNYGPVTVAFFWDSPNFNTSKSAYYYSGSSNPNHAVLIVGWDDNYAASNFKATPPGNGAWIVKNSWGTDWGSNGFFYLSYYDSSLEGGIAYKADEGENYARVYDYDPLGWVGSWGSYTPTGAYTPSNTAWMANVFTAAAAEPLRAVSFYAGSSNTAYEIRVYRGVTDGNPRSGQEAASQPQGGTLGVPGYRTVVLDNAVNLQKNERFSIVVKLTTPSTIRPIPVEYRVAGYSDNASASANQSFVSLDGTTWQDASTLSNSSNVCLKAFAGTGSASTIPSSPETPAETGPTTPSDPDGSGGGGGGCNAAGLPFAGFFLLVPLFALARGKP